MGVTTKKNIIPMTMGAIKLPRNIPNLNQVLFSGVSIFEFNKPSIQNIIDIINDHILISLPFSNGQKVINPKTNAKTIPKLLFELIFVSL